MFHTIDQGFPRVRNVVYEEMTIKVFDSMSKQQFLQHVTMLAEKFWSQVRDGGIDNKRFNV